MIVFLTWLLLLTTAPIRGNDTLLPLKMTREQAIKYAGEDYANVTNIVDLMTIGPRIFEAVEIWRDFQHFAQNHSIMHPSEAERICTRFESTSIHNYSRIGDTQKWQLHDHDVHIKKPMRILFLTTKRSLLLLSDRWYFELYMAMASQPGVEAVMWGVGMPGFRDDQTTRQNMMRWFTDPEFDIVHSTWTYQRTVRGIEDQGSGKGLGHVNGRSREFGDLPGSPLITVVVQEVAMNMDELWVKPHLVFVVYEQQLGVQAGRVVDTCGELGISGGNSSSSEEVSAGGCPMNPVIQKLLVGESNRTMVAFLPHGVNVQKFDLVEEEMKNPPLTDTNGSGSGSGSGSGGHGRRNHTSHGRGHGHRNLTHNSTALGGGHRPAHAASPYKHLKINASRNATERPVNILLVGATLASIYPLRHNAQLASRKHTKLITQLRHPGYSLEYDDLCSMFGKSTMPQQSRYTRSLLESKVCLIGTAVQLVDVCRQVAWTVRKYAETIGAGCVVVGDVPADVNLARFVQERLAGQSPQELAQSAELIMSRYNQGEYTRIRDEGKAFVRTHYSITAIVKNFYLPAVKAYRQGERGIYRPTQSKVIVRNDRTDSCSTVNAFVNTTDKKIPLKHILRLGEKDVQKKYVHPFYQ